ncbi:metal ABC transporter substrate-binding protein [Dehalobacter sp. DCM]|uniref:metal ABC transporter substrate-binding protein n=1 Tax=Dehalobacter sp. DCM TaxID=2907827 RepID=UPI003081C5B6|nr:metal ABC transporter substrate-binding protein [Dehalobacter sp. DCM]
MRTRRWMVAVVMLLSVLVLFNGCGAKGDTSAKVSANAEPVVAQGPITIATSFYPIYIFTLNIAKDIPGVSVVNMTEQTAGCLHDYALSTKDMKNIENTQILIINGAGMESFMDKIIAQRPDLRIIDSSQGIELITEDGNENPHVWVSISKAMQQVQTIGDQLAILDPQHADNYAENTAAYLAKLEAERVKMHQVLDGLTHRDIVTFHEAFPYFAEEFNLNIVGVIEREPNTEPSAKELAETIEIIKQLKVKALFAEPQYSAKIAKTIAQETGARVYTLDPAVTGPMDADAYISIMDQNLKILKEALQ